MALVRITADQLRLGMFVERIEGSWLSHPFWKSRFRLDDPADLETLRASGITALWVEESIASDPVTETIEASPEPLATEAPPAPVPAPARRRRAMPASLAAAPTRFDQEYANAVRIVSRAKGVVLGLFEDARLGRSLDLAEVVPLVDEVAASVSRNASALVTLTRLKTKDEYTFLHSVAVCALMVSLSRQLGLDRETMREAGIAGLLHDIGKMAMPPEVLNKPGALSDDEYLVMKSHPERGHEMLRQIESVPAGALDVCLHHHEKVDGSGYPHGLRGGDISLLARMGAVCDVYDAITSHRPYKAAWNAADSVARMYGWQGHFDEPILSAFIRSIGIYPLGTLVRLSNHQLAVVVEQNHDRLTCPIVRVFHDIVARRSLDPFDVDLSSPRHEIAIVAKEDPRNWGMAEWDQRSAELMRRSARLRAAAA